MTPREANADLLAEITALRDRMASLDRRIAELQAALAQAVDQEAATSLDQLFDPPPSPRYRRQT